MSTLPEITYNLAMLSGDDEDTAQINRYEEAVVYHRALIARRDLSLHSDIAPQFSSPLGCLKTVEADSAQCFGVDLPCNLVRTKKKIPAPLRLKGGNGFLFVGTVDTLTKYSEMSMEDLRFINAGTFSNSLPRYIYWDGYLYILNAKPEKVKVNLIVADPRKLEEYTNCDGDVAYDREVDEFPMPEDMVQRITQAIISGEIRIDKPEDLGEVKLENEQV